MCMPAAPPASIPIWDVFESPIGPLTVEAGPAGLRSLSFPGRARGLDESRRAPASLAPVLAQLEEYFAGERHAFDVDLDLRGDELQLSVWRRLLEIPYGATTTYGEIGRLVGHADPRDIGRCVGTTPVPVIVPCHRVIGADGSLTGYGGGLHRKRALLELERRATGGPLPAWAHRQLELI
jgi:methylated-DNA-[protein]-cysteine S-methyltransferase